MNTKIEKLLAGKGENYMLPFFWQHGEDEQTLRAYMKVINEANIKAVCVESRPHPDYCGPKWWEDMDIILDEARERGMKVWILDDSHFPTGFANGAMESQPDERCRQSICFRVYECEGHRQLKVKKEEILHPCEVQPSQLEAMLAQGGDGTKKKERIFTDDRLLVLMAVRIDEEKNGFLDAKYRIDLTNTVSEEGVCWQVPEGCWRVYALHLTRNRGPHRNYINMMDRASCRVLLDAVYEPHWEHYKEDFGKTIAGFFSDEPELGNGHLYESGNIFGASAEADFPWSTELEERLLGELKEDFALSMVLLWENEAPDKIKAKARYTYMDGVTRLVEEDFSFQLGNWCREHGVAYIGHLIEDNDQHARTGSSLGHFFRGLGGQDMAGIDDIGGQVFPGGEDLCYDRGPFQKRDGEFYHYMLGRLASSHAAIDPLKKGDSMCEIFGAYGWSEGVRLEKYLLDHFMVRGINHFVPHAFSAKAFPDPDCPPHFYAHGNHPQYRHFGSLMAYANRVCELISGGRHIAFAAVLYHGEGEWTGETQFSHKVGHVLDDAQIAYDYLPQDVFVERKRYRSSIADGILKVNTQEYKAVIVPKMQFVTAAFAAAVTELLDAGINVYFTDAYPKGACDLITDDEGEQFEKRMAEIHRAKLVMVEDIAEVMHKAGAAEITINPANNRIRYYHYEGEDKSAVYLLVNESEKCYTGELRVTHAGMPFFYDAWENCIHGVDYSDGILKITLEPLKSQILIFAEDVTEQEIAGLAINHLRVEGKERLLTGSWKRSICRSIEYPRFKDEKEIVIPDRLEEEVPEFSGFVRYENRFTAEEGDETVLLITEAGEGVEVFINGRSLGIQVAPPFCYGLKEFTKEGENFLVIEVATTLEREMSKHPDMFGRKQEPKSLSGINGEVKLFVLE